MRFLSVAFLILLIIIIINLVNKKSCEGFDNSENYNSCVSKGFSKEFVYKHHLLCFSQELVDATMVQ